MTNFSGGMSKAIFRQEWVLVIRGHWFWYQSKACICDFLLVRNSNLGSILHFYVLLPHLYSNVILRCSRYTRSLMLWSASEWVLSYLAVKLFSKNSNLC